MKTLAQKYADGLYELTEDLEKKTAAEAASFPSCSRTRSMAPSAARIPQLMCPPSSAGPTPRKAS